MTERRPDTNLPQPDPQTQEPSSQSSEPSANHALSRPNPVIPAQSLPLADAGTGIHTVDPEREKMRENGREIQKSGLTFRQQAAMPIWIAHHTLK